MSYSLHLGYSVLAIPTLYRAMLDISNGPRGSGGGSRRFKRWPSQNLVWC